MPDRKWIFDAVTLSNFLLSDSATLLRKRYKGAGLITAQVFDELSGGAREHPGLNVVDSLIRGGTLTLVSLSGRQLRQYDSLLNHLGKGEASSILYAKAHKATVVTDDRAARAECARLKVAFTGTIGILVASVADKQITVTQADDILRKMIQAGFYSPVSCIRDITD